MAKLDIGVNRAAAVGNAVMMGLITLLMAALLLSVVLMGRFTEMGAFDWLLFSCLFGWIFTFLIGWTVRLIRLSQFKGTRLQITEEGIIDYGGSSPQKMYWEEMAYTKWKNLNLAPVLAFIPKRKTASHFIRHLIGLPRFEYRSIYLDITEAELAQFMIDHAPNDLLR